MKKITNILIFFMLLCTTLCAEDEQKNLVYEIKSFEKGQNTKTSPFSLPENQGDICQNVRFNEEFGSIYKRQNLNVYGTADATNPILGMHRFYMKDGTKTLLVNAEDKLYKGTDSSGAFTEILDLTTGDRRWQWTTWHDIAIGCDGYNQPVKYDGTSDSATYLGSCLATDAGDGAGPDGTYSYKISFYTATYEVIFDVASNEIIVSDNDIDLTMIPIGPDTYLGESVVGRKVYRTESGGSTYKLLTNGTIADNTTVVLTDSDADGALGVAYPTVDNSTIFSQTPPTGRFSIIHDGRLWFANDPTDSPSRAWYSDSESHELFQADSYWDIRQNDGDAVTFIKQVLGILTIGKENSISKLYTDGLTTDWSLSDPFTFIGCHAPYTVANYARGLIYLNFDGLYTFNGQYSQLISDAITPEINDINSSDFANAWGIYHRNIYYLAYSSEVSTASYNDRVLVYDIISDAYSIDLLNINCFTAFNSGNDWGVLYSGASDVGKVYSYEISDNQIVHRRQGDFTGLWDDMRYIPTEVGGDSDSAILEISRTETIDELTGTINELKGTIDRADYEGNYTSQVLKIDSVSYDKLYWSEIVPSGDVTIKLRTSATGEQNLLLNDCFEFWDNCVYDQATTPSTIVQPNDWVAASTSTSVIACQSETTTVYRGDYSARVNTEATITQVLLNGSDYAGKTLVFSAWLKNSDAVNVENAYIEIQEGGGEIIGTGRAYYGIESTAWRATSTTLTLSASATTVTLKCATMGNGITSPTYFDQVMVIEGSSATNDWTAWSDAYTDSSGSDISEETTNTYLQYLIEMETDDLTETPNIVVRDNYAIRLTYNKEGAAQSNSIPMIWRSGWLDLGNTSIDKVLRRLLTKHEGTTGTFTVLVETLAGDTDTFEIDLSEYPETYEDAFTGMALVGRYFRITISKDDANDFKFRRLSLLYDKNPIQ